ncbi:hypothetical protein [Sphingomonas sp.]|uniref:hypothetical protein n=1 Tax=Sphingomonas sp. TaxID=28214 RepID=UPI0025DBD235|nr:hypothetical protein [Sphingomonas sp.]
MKGRPDPDDRLPDKPHNASEADAASGSAAAREPGAPDPRGFPRGTVALRHARIRGAVERGEDWRPIARTWLGVDPAMNEAAAWACWCQAVAEAELFWEGRTTAPRTP